MTYSLYSENDGFPKLPLLDRIRHCELGVTKKKNIDRIYRLKLGFRTFINKFMGFRAYLS